MAKKPAKPKQTEIVKAIKGFDADLKCRDFQYEVGKTYEHGGDVVMCGSGFHACEGSPFDVWGYYGPVGDDGKLARYADVSLTGFVRDSDQSDSKIAAATITIEAEINLPDFIRRAVSWIADATKGKGDNPSGDSAQIGSSGYYAKIGSSGDYAQIGSSGHSAQIGSSGHSAKIGSSGHSAKIGSSGYYAKIVAEGADSVIATAGPGTSVSGADGAWISVAEFKDGKCVGFATGCIGKDGLDPNTPYVARDGKLVPVSQASEAGE